MTRAEIIEQIEKLNAKQRATMRDAGGALGQIIHVKTTLAPDGSASVSVVRKYDTHTTSHFAIVGSRGGLHEHRTERQKIY